MPGLFCNVSREHDSWTGVTGVRRETQSDICILVHSSWIFRSFGSFCNLVIGSVLPGSRKYMDKYRGTRAKVPYTRARYNAYSICVTKAAFVNTTWNPDSDISHCSTRDIIDANASSIFALLAEGNFLTDQSRARRWRLPHGYRAARASTCRFCQVYLYIHEEKCQL